jgi:hypothetical protein
MTTLVLTTNVATPDAEDRRAMEFIIGLENTRRAALTPPGTPLVFSTAAERKTAYETCLNALMISAHASYIKQANESVLADPQFQDLRPLWKDASVEKKAAAIAALQ